VSTTSRVDFKETLSAKPEPSPFTKAYMVRSIRSCANTGERRLTLKAFANSSPGLRFGNSGKEAFTFLEDATLKELRRRSPPVKRRNSFRVAKNPSNLLSPGFQSNPGLEFANAFSVMHRLEFSHSPGATGSIWRQRCAAKLLPERILQATESKD
jgi:hypothetical protein